MPSSNAEPVVDEVSEPTPTLPKLIILEPEDDDAGVCTPEGVCD